MKTLFTLLFVVCLFYSCQTSNSSDKGVSLSDLMEDENDFQDQKFISIVSGLKIRSVPDVESEIIATLNFEEEVTYLNEDSDFKEKLKINGELKYDTWKKIKTNYGLEGWVFGGGLEDSEKIYTQDDENFFSRSYSGIKKEELSEILNMIIEDNLRYDGTGSFIKNENGRLINHGDFTFKGRNEYGVTVDIKGQFENGMPIGLFERNLKGYENGNTTLLNFKNGKCLWGSISGSGEGMDYHHKEENPKECSFYFIEKAMVEKDNSDNVAQRAYANNTESRGNNNNTNYSEFPGSSLKLVNAKINYTYSKKKIFKKQKVTGNEITGYISNNAQRTSFKDAKLNVKFYSKSNTLLSSKEIIIYEKFFPGAQTFFKKKIFLPNETYRYNISFVTASYL